MNNNIKDSMRKNLLQYKEGIRAVINALLDVPGAEQARKSLYQAEMGILSGSHEISWIGVEKEQHQEEINNPSA